ncbi:MAG: response regulator [Bacteroidota bacterium]
MKARDQKKILIIENDESLLDVMRQLFEEEGYEVLDFRTVDDIFLRVAEFDPDVVLLDYLLPGINGGELCAQLKRDETTSHIPVVICSAYPQVLLSLGSYGCNAFIAKPFDLADMLQQVENCRLNPDQVFKLS